MARSPRPFLRSSALRAAPPEAARRETRRHRRWAAVGAALGLAVGIVSFLPASLVANGVASATGDRMQLAEAEGTVWNGSALMVLTGGPGSRDASVLPSRLVWQLRPHWNGLALHLTQDCCIPGADLRVHAGWSTTRIEVGDAPGDGTWAQWPAGWLEGLGSLWKTVKPGGLLRVGSHQFQVTRQGDAWRLGGDVRFELRQASARLTTLDTLGSYQVVISGTPATPNASTTPAAGGERAHVVLRTLDGSLLLDGSGDIDRNGLHFRGQARAAPGTEGALDNLLNIIGRRSGATSLITYG